MNLTNYLLINVSTSTAKNGSPFATVTLKTIKEGVESKLTVNLWGIPANFNPPLFSKVTILDVKEKDGFYSTTSANFTYSKLPEDSELNTLIRVITPRQDWIDVVKSILSKMGEVDPLWKPFLKEQFSKLYDVYKLHPAAKVNHHAYPGGLLDHVYQMLQILDRLHDVVPIKTRIEVCALGILYHDYGKISEYRDGTYVEEFFTMGHIYMGAHVLHSLMTNYGFSYNDTVRTVHCVLAHHGKLEHGSPVKPATGEAFLVHMIDAISGHGYIYDETGHMEKSLALGTNVIHFKD